MALMGFFTLSMIVMIVWVVKRLVTKAITGFDTVGSAINSTRDAIWSLKTAVELNTARLDDQGRINATYVERLSDEIRESRG